MALIIRGDFSNSERSNYERGGLDAGISSIACLSLSPEPGDVRGNLLLAAAAIRTARLEEPALRWVVLPELVTCGYSDLESVHRFAEDAETGESIRFFAALARELGIYIAYGLPEAVAGSVAGVYDSANLVGPEGVLATYRKRNLVGTTPEHYVFDAGTELPVVEAGGMRVALVVCWDLGFPETAREAVMGGADLILAPAAWREPWGPQYDLSCAARALDSGVYVASANQIGAYPEARFGSPGHLYGPDGVRVSESLGQMSLGVIDPSAPERWRGLYGNTLMENKKVASIGEEPLEICS
ncbi:MAG TPA: carbon-nitrogen hydrolase family protein [Rubrobacteraceae bacterium]|nr:carbon-nitrogen hydrolase family protein [Rubrobacteraceae bacterium]